MTNMVCNDCKRGFTKEFGNEDYCPHCGCFDIKEMDIKNEGLEVENKLDVIKRRIKNLDAKIEGAKNKIMLNHDCINKYMDQNSFHWVRNAAEGIAKYCAELEKYEEMKRELQEILDFFN